jgi:hypothetical protein
MSFPDKLVIWTNAGIAPLTVDRADEALGVAAGRASPEMIGTFAKNWNQTLTPAGRQRCQSGRVAPFRTLAPGAAGSSDRECGLEEI